MQTKAPITVLNILSGGNIGGIEKLYLSIGKISEYRQINILISGAGPVSDAMTAKGLDVRDLTIKHQSGILSNILRIVQQAKRLKKICKSEGIDIVAAHHGSTDVYLLSLVLRIIMFGSKRPSFIRHFHGVFDEGDFRSINIIAHLRKRIERHLMAVVIWLSDSVIAISKASLNSYANAFSISERKQNVVYNCIDDSFFSHPHKEKQKDGIPRLIYTGRLEKVKGVHCLLEAMNMISRNEDVKYHLDIVGDGSQMDNLKELCAQLGMIDKVSFCGFKADVKGELSNSDIFVHPAQWEEGFGLSLVEAMAMGLICVVTPSGGMKEIITDGYNGFMSEDKSAEKLEVALRRAFQVLKGEQHEMIVMNARKTAEKFKVVVTVRGFAEVYKSVFEKKRTAKGTHT